MSRAVLHLADCLDVLRAMPAESVDAVVTDPPYELGFMGRKWDSTGIAFRADLWAECLRVLKPGGHLVAFGGQRTIHRLTCALEDGGWEIRDQIGWVYWSGFPKSLDVSKAIDARRDDSSDVLRVTALVRAARDAAGLTNRDIDTAFGTNGMAGHWTTAASQPLVPTWEQWGALRDLLGFGDEMDAEVWRLNGRKGTPGEAFGLREVVGQREKLDSWGGEYVGHVAPSGVVIPITTGATEASRQWSGWGTALKPAIEPAVLARKPLIGTVAANIQRHGTGALNIDGCRYPQGDPAWPGPQDVAAETHAASGEARGGSYGGYGASIPGQSIGQSIGRWPANLYACPKASRSERERGCEGLPARNGAENIGREEGAAGTLSPRAGAGRTAAEVRNVHPTVKPVALMRWLCRLVTPPGGVVLDPFTGSGTTGIAAVLEGFRFIGCEREAEYHAIAAARIACAERGGWETKPRTARKPRAAKVPDERPLFALVAT